MFRKIKNLIAKLSHKSNNLILLREYTYSSGYSTNIGYAYETIDTIINKFKSKVDNRSGVAIESSFNNINYAFFDLDTKEKMDLFEKLYEDVPHVIFISSIKIDGDSGLAKKSDNNEPEHYWGIVDIPYNKKSEIFREHNWKICNDQKYVEYCREYDSIRIRGLYENDSRKPRIYKENGVFSKNFKLFIDKLTTFYNNEGLELSVLRYKDPKMLILFNRRKKLQNIEKNENT
jgi:hypothetical protein